MSGFSRSSGCNKQPPSVIHANYRRSDSFAAIVNDAATALHMGKGERALLDFYAACSSGFRPSLQAIASATGQNRSQVWRNRNALVKHGVVAERSDAILIDWNRLKLYATLDPRLTSKRCVCAPAFAEHERLSVFEFKALPLDKLLRRLNAMSDPEYDDIVERLAA